MTWRTVYLRAPLIRTKTVTIKTGPGRTEQREIPLDEPYYDIGGKAMDCIVLGKDGDDALLICRQCPTEIPKDKEGRLLGKSLAEVKRDHPQLYSNFTDGGDVPRIKYFGAEE